MIEDLIEQIRLYVAANLPEGETTAVYAFKRPIKKDSITIKTSSSPAANVRMWSQEFFITVEVIKKESPKASFDLCRKIRDVLLDKKGTFVSDGARVLSIYANNTIPEVMDVTQDRNEVYGILYKVKYIDNTIPV